MPRVKMTKSVRASLYFLLIYLVFLLALIVVRFVQAFE
jgi:hypothetical protein